MVDDEKTNFAAAIAGSALLALSSNAQAACGSVSIAEMNWASAQLWLMWTRLFCKKVMDAMWKLFGDTMPTFT